jgi:class 3 adenylate cyclase/tetratricopeptide (TPR) repeat protein
VPADARFCPSCGHALHVPTDERRVVTVLFGDLVGFTSLSETRDPEQVKNLVDRCFEALAADITSFGGRVDKIVGDAVVALFGAPVAHEDDAERAVRAALQMQRTLAGTAETLGVRVRMRIGVNTGEVLVGALRAGGDYTAMGDVVNTASRLQAAAAPGQIMVGPETYAATSQVFAYEPLGELQARGREAPVPAWSALEAVTAPGRRPRRSEAPLVGRDAEVSLLCSAMQTAFAYERPHLVLLMGDAGIGKSRLAEDVIARSAEQHGAAILLGRTVPYGEANVWWPIAEAIRAVCGIGVDDTASEARSKCVGTVASLVGEAAESPDATRTADALLYLMGYGGRLSDVDPQRARDEAARAMRSLLEGLAARVPVILTIADVQWADPLVLELVDHLLERLHRLPLVIFLTSRPELELSWRPTPGRHNLVVLNLDPLDERAAGELLTSLLGSEPDPAVRAALVERSGGNPFFLEELVALLSERGEVAPGAVPSLPATLRGLVAARLDALPSDERGVLEDAAVLGRHGPLAALDSLGGGPVRAIVDRLVARELLALDGELFEFRSDLVRVVAYGTLTKAARARRHAELASWLDGLASEKERGDEIVELVARHWSTAAELAGELGPGVPGVPPDAADRALEALERAAERAEDRELHAVACSLFDQMLRLLGDEPTAARRHALIGRARANTAHRHDDLAAADLDAAEADAVAAGDDVALARALTVRGDLLRNIGEFAGSLAVLERAVVLWRALGDRRGEASALRRTGMTLLFGGDNDAAEPLIHEALSAFQEIGARRGIAWAHQNLAWIAFNRGESDAAEERLREAIDMFADIGDWGGLSWALGLLSWVLYSRGRASEAESLAERVIVEGRDQGDRWALGMMTVLLGSIRLWRGRTEEALEALLEARQVLDELGDPWARVRARGPLSRALAAVGRLDDAREAIEECREIAQGLPTTETSRMGAVLGAEIAVHAGQAAEALRVLEGQPVPTGGGFGDVELGASLALALAQSGDPDGGLEVLEPVARRAGDVGPQANARSALALVLAAAGRPAEAAAAAEAVLAMDQATYADRVSAALALACAAAGTGDADGARAAIDVAADLVAPTSDRLTAAVVELGRSRVLALLGDPQAGPAGDGARARFAAMGVEPTGWDVLFGLATGAAARA